MPLEMPEDEFNRLVIEIVGSNPSIGDFQLQQYDIDSPRMIVLCQKSK